MSDPTVRGVVHLIDDTKTYGQNGFRKRMVVLEQDTGRFTNYIPVDFIQEGCDTVDDMNEGDEVEVTYRLNGRKWQRDANSEVKYFLNAEALSFSVVKKSGGGAAASDSGDGPSLDDRAAEEYVSEDDVPF